MGDLSDRTFLITGGNTGIGKATAAALAGRGGRVFIACRSPVKGRAAAAEIASASGRGSVDFLPVDLADLASVRRCAGEFLARDVPLHVLINNAGVAGRRGITRDGFELMFGVNHLGHFALATALLGCLQASAPARIVTVSSDAHYQARGIDFSRLRQRTHAVTGLPEYAVSKLCNVLFTQELGRRLAGTGVTTYALHPGVVASDIWRRVPWPVRPLVTRRLLSTEQGAATSVYCAASRQVAAATGRYYDDCHERRPSPVATGELASQLWDRSVAWASGRS